MLQRFDRNRLLRVAGTALLLLAWLAAADCSRPGQTAPKTTEKADQDTEALGRIHDLIQLWASDLNRGNAESAVSIYAAGIVYMPPGRPPLEGPEQVKQFLQSQFPAGRSSLSYSSRETQISGDLAYERGVFVTTLESPGERHESKNGNLLRLFHRSEDGAWKVTREIWNISLDSTVTEPAGPSGRP